MHLPHGAGVYQTGSASRPVGQRGVLGQNGEIRPLYSGSGFKS